MSDRAAVGPSLPEVAEAQADGRGGRRQLLISLAGLALLYGVVIALGSPRAWSGSDAGGKVATVRQMAQHHSLIPEVGYWAKDLDPTGIHHALIKTTVIGGRFVQVTSLPFMYAGLLLWRVGGFDGLLVLPLLGSLLAAYAGRRLALALGAQRGWLAFWIVGAGSPMVFYAGDFWEHSMAVGLGLVAMALLLEGGSFKKALAAGIVGGCAGVLRADVIVCVAAAGVGVLATPVVRRLWFAHPFRVVAAGVSFLLPLIAERLAEAAALPAGAGAGLGSRSAYSVNQAGSMLTQRTRDAFITTVGLFPDDSNRFLFGGFVVISVLLLLIRTRAMTSSEGAGTLPGWVLERVGLATVVGAYVLRFTSGLGFVSGLFPASPVSAVGLAMGTGSQAEAGSPTRGTGGRSRAVWLTAVVAIPVIWLFEWQGQLFPQWGGRYVLLPSALLAVLGAVTIERSERWSFGAGLALWLTFAVTAFGAAWHIERTRSVAAGGAAIEQVGPDVVVISQIQGLGREEGAVYGNHRWLTSDSSGDLDNLLPILRGYQVKDVEVVGIERGSPTPVLAGYVATTVRHVDFLNFEFRITAFHAA